MSPRFRRPRGSFPRRRPCATPRPCRSGIGQSSSPAPSPRITSNRCAKSPRPTFGSAWSRGSTLAAITSWSPIFARPSASPAGRPLRSWGGKKTRGVAGRLHSRRHARHGAFAIGLFRGPGASAQGDLRNVAADFERSVSETAAAVTQTSDALQASAHRMDGSVRTTVAQAQAAETAAAHTSANVNAVSAATAQLSYSVGEIGQQTRRSHEIARASAEASQKSESMIAQLSLAAEQIGGFVGMINAIAGKTNMLALNATIEAARAGEAGRGFAVVASEVKALADQTARATAEIGEKISAIQASTEAFRRKHRPDRPHHRRNIGGGDRHRHRRRRTGGRDARNHPEHHRSVNGRRRRRGERPGGRARGRRRHRRIQRSFGGVAPVDASGWRPHIEHGAVSSIPERGINS